MTRGWWDVGQPSEACRYLLLCHIVRNPPVGSTGQSIAVGVGVGVGFEVAVWTGVGVGVLVGAGVVGIGVGVPVTPNILGVVV